MRSLGRNSCPIAPIFFLVIDIRSRTEPIEIGQHLIIDDVSKNSWTFVWFLLMSSIIGFWPISIGSVLDQISITRKKIGAIGQELRPREPGQTSLDRRTNFQEFLLTSSIIGFWPISIGSVLDRISITRKKIGAIGQELRPREPGQTSLDRRTDKRTDGQTSWKMFKTHSDGVLGCCGGVLNPF